VLSVECQRHRLYGTALFNGAFASPVSLISATADGLPFDATTFEDITVGRREAKATSDRFYHNKLMRTCLGGLRDQSDCGWSLTTFG
jgi:hypothetical protein